MVDVGRVDSYTADGSLTRPYKTLTDAINNAPSGKVVFKVSPNTYTENLVVTDNMHFVADGAGRSVQVDGTVLYNTAGGNPSSFSGFIINGAGTNPTVQFYGSNSQELRLDNCKVISSGLQPSLHMNNTNTGSALYANQTEFYNAGSGLAVLVNGNNKFEHRMCKFEADSNVRCIEYDDSSIYSGYMSYFANQVKVSDSAIGELHHPIFDGSGQDAIQHDGGVLKISAPVNFTGQPLFSPSSTGDIQYSTIAGALGYTQDEPTDWLTSHIIVSTALDELASRITTLEGGGTPSYDWYDATGSTYWYVDEGTWAIDHYEPDGVTNNLYLDSAFFAFAGGSAPTVMRLTFTGLPTINVTIIDANGSTTIVSNATYASGDILDVSGGYTRYRIEIPSCTGLQLSAIEFDEQAEEPS
jgi:hypothetical protein